MALDLRAPSRHDYAVSLDGPRLSRRGAPMDNLAHSASFESLDKDAPSKAETKQLISRRAEPFPRGRYARVLAPRQTSRREPFLLATIEGSLTAIINDW
jgi:hypothetical protein